MAEAFITLEQAGVLLGGAERPFSRYTVEKLISLGRLKDNGGTRKLRRVSRASVDALIREVENGGSLLCHADEKPTTVKAQSTSRRPARAAGSPRSSTATVRVSDDGPIVAIRPRRSGKRWSADGMED
jgi:hypothetical protein